MDKKNKQLKELIKVQKQALKKANFAIRELTVRAENEKALIEASIVLNVKVLCLPVLHELDHIRNISKYVKTLRNILEDLTSPFVSVLYEKKLTSREIKIASMTRAGVSAKETAETLKISILTVEKHRSAIRRKLGATHSKKRLFEVLNQY